MNVLFFFILIHEALWCSKTWDFNGFQYWNIDFLKMLYPKKWGIFRKSCCGKPHRILCFVERLKSLLIFSISTFQHKTHSDWSKNLKNLKKSSWKPVKRWKSFKIIKKNIFKKVVDYTDILNVICLAVFVNQMCCSSWNKIPKIQIPKNCTFLWILFVLAKTLNI